MTLTTLTIDIKPDAIKKLGDVAPIKSIEELVWNSLDGEAHRIDITFERNAAQGIECIRVSDDGHGIQHDEAIRAFGGIGGSSKRKTTCSPKLKRTYHGKAGKGRYTAFAIARKIEWHSRYSEAGQSRQFTATLKSENLSCAQVGEPSRSNQQPGCEVVLSNLKDNTQAKLDCDKNIDILQQTFAPYLMAHRNVTLVYDGTPIQPKKAIKHDELIEFAISSADTSEMSATIRVIEWAKPASPIVFVCRDGVAFEEFPAPKLKGFKSSYSAYLQGEYVDNMYSGDGNFMRQADRMDKLKAKTKEELRNYALRRQSEEMSDIITCMRKDNIYPYDGAAGSKVEIAERHVFNICAATIYEYLPKFAKSDKSHRKLTLQLLKSSLESRPSDLNTILGRVLALTDEQRADLAGLLARTSLASIIAATKTVTERLAFLRGLSDLLHSKETRNALRERKELHRILVEELWIFGDEYALGADDVGLKRVLEAHKQILGHDASPQTPENGANLAGIPDLLLWRKYLRQPNEYEHLIIELKRPSCSISQTEIGQVKKYANSIRKERAFDKERTRWRFVVVSNRIAEDALDETLQEDRPQGLVLQATNYSVWAVTWQQILHDASIRLEWFKTALNLNISEETEGMEYLRNKYSNLLPEAALAKAE